MGLFSTPFGSGKKERKEANLLGMTVLEVTRDLPEFSDDGRTVSMGPDSCVRYSIPRRTRGGPVWSLLQRTKAMGATLPNDYLLATSEALPNALLERLQQVAAEYSEELLEFEGTATDVAVYWMEWGGRERVRALHAHLHRLATF